MLWSRKQKVHKPFGNDFNLITIWVTPPSGSRYVPFYIIPDNWYCQLIGATALVKSGAFGLLHPWIEVKRRGRYAWIFPWSVEIPANEQYQVCWGIGLPSSPIDDVTDVSTAPLADECYLEGGDEIRFEYQFKPIDGLMKNVSIYLKQWIIY